MITQEAAVGASRELPETARLPVVRVWPRLRSLLLPAGAFASVALYFGIRTMLQVVPEGDATLHLHLMETVANGHLPKTVPFFAAVVEKGGEIGAFFPYSYTPLYHLVGGAVFRVGGERAVLMMGPFWAGIIGVGLVYLLGSFPRPALALALALIFLQYLTQPVMTWVFMEPMMLAFFIGGLCFYQRAWSGGTVRDATIAGVFFGLAVATRQSALLYVAFVAAHGGITLLMRSWRRFRSPEHHATFALYAAMAASTAVVSLPFLAYLAWVTGTIGYGEFSFPGLAQTLAVDPVANGYLSGITTPDGSIIDWLDRFWSATLYVERWQSSYVAYLVFVPFAIGMVYLATRKDGASRFLASYIPVHLLGEMVLFVTIHGSWRYIIATRVLFYAVVAVGVWWLLRWAYRAAYEEAHWQSVLTGAGASALVVATLAPAFVAPGLIDHLIHQEESRAERGRAFQELGEFVQERVPEDALLLSGRWYSTGYYLRRNYTWVTYFGNSWVVDAISTPNAWTARDMLEEYGIDYVVIQAPPATYVDRMPQDGLRRLVLNDLDHFQLIFVNERTRLYEFWPEGIQR